MFGRAGGDVDGRVGPEEVVLRLLHLADRDEGHVALAAQRGCLDRPDLARERRRDRERVGVRVDVDHLAEAGMGGRAVVALEVVLERDLPVRVDRPPRGGSGSASVVEVEAAARDDRRQLAERLRERRRVGIGVDEEERAPGVDRDGEQREVGRVEARLALRAGRLAQRAVELVRPRVVRALQRLAAAAAARDRVRAVAADVDEAAQDALAVAGDDDRDVARLGRHERAGRRDLLRRAAVLPGAGEDALALERRDAGIGVPRRGQRPALLERVLERRKPSEMGVESALMSPDCLVSQGIGGCSMGQDIGQDGARMSPPTPSRRRPTGAPASSRPPAA